MPPPHLGNQGAGLFGAEKKNQEILNITFVVSNIWIARETEQHHHMNFRISNKLKKKTTTLNNFFHSQFHIPCEEDIYFPSLELRGRWKLQKRQTCIRMKGVLFCY